MITYWEVWAKKPNGWRHYQEIDERRAMWLGTVAMEAGFDVTIEKRTMSLTPR